VNFYINKLRGNAIDPQRPNSLPLNRFQQLQLSEITRFLLKRAQFYRQATVKKLCLVPIVGNTRRKNCSRSYRGPHHHQIEDEKHPDERRPPELKLSAPFRPASRAAPIAVALRAT
jgi:hypothetical protein